MTATSYSIWSKGPEKKDAGGFHAEHYDVGVHALAKRSTTNDRDVASEWIAFRLAASLNLPVAIGCPLKFRDEWYWASMILGASGHKLPPGAPDALASTQRSVACGIVVFDSWICNIDRHEKNWAYNEFTEEVFIFDHGHSLMAHGQETLQEFSDKIVIDRFNHSIAMALKSFVSFDDWLDRILDLPTYIIKDAVSSTAKLGVQNNDIELCSTFLLERRERLREFFFNHQTDSNVFPALEPSLVGSISLEDDDDSHIEYYI